MRLELVLVCMMLLGTPLAGCLDGGEQLDPQASPEDGAGDDETGQTPSDDGASDGSSQTSGEGGDQAGSNETSTEAEQATNDTSSETDSGEEAPAVVPANPPMAVVAHIDTGINPYHEAFRLDTALAHTHPSEYIDGYPEDAKALNLTLEAATYAQALEADQDVWANVSEDELYWIPGTRIVGAISMGEGGSRDSETDDPVMTVEEIVEAAQNQNITGLLASHDTNILDNHGHGTMTASRAVGETTSLAPNARFVSIEGLGADGVRWAADQGWIDVQTNSWVDFVPPPANQLQDDVPEASTASTSEAFAYASDRMVTVAASGNGAAYTAGFVPTPTYALSTAPEDVILVGGHDNGYFAPWSGSPPHVVADGFRPLAAVFDSMTEVRAHSYSCCTSAAAPYAAGGAASIITQARQILGDESVGVEDGVVAEGPQGEVPIGPLEDGELTLTEVREVLLHTAQIPPEATRHDGTTHFAAQPTTEQPNDPTQPGENAYCPGCWTTPVTYDDLPSEVPTYAYTGYGAINVFSDQQATSVLAGTEEMPARDQADELYSTDQTVRGLYYPPTNTPSP